MIEKRQLGDPWGEGHVPFLSFTMIIFYSTAHLYFMHSSVTWVFFLRYIHTLFSVSLYGLLQTIFHVMILLPRWTAYLTKPQVLEFKIRY